MTIRFAPLCGTVLAAAVALPAGAASATTPASLWAGVERIAVRCGGTGVADADRARICDAVIAELRSRSSFPVVAADQAYVPEIYGDLVLVVTASAGGGGKVDLSIQPTRVGNGLGAARAQAPSRATIASGARGARLGRAIAGVVTQILPVPQQRRGRVPSPKRAS